MRQQRNRKTRRQFCKQSGKRRFPDRKAALQAIHRFANQMLHGSYKESHVIPVRAYFCHHCNGYHLTSKHNREDAHKQQTEPQQQDLSDKPSPTSHQ